MKAGRLSASGTPDTVLTPERIAECFGVRAHRWTHPGTGRPLLAFDEIPTPHSAGSALQKWVGLPR